MKTQHQNATKPLNLELCERLTELQRAVFVGEQTKRDALDEIRRIAGPSFAETIESLATTPRARCVRCSGDFAVDELGESGACSDCFTAEEEAT